MLEKYLEKLDAIIDPDHVSRSEQRVMSAVSYEPVDRLPVSVTCPVPDWPTFTYREAFYDMEKMLLNELQAVWVGANVRDDRMYTIRANYGVGTVASMFGCRITLTDDNIMPWAFPLSDEDLDKVLQSGPVDIEAGLGSRVLETERFYLDTLSRYENLARCVHVFVCDTQGPFDTAHLVMGHKIYTEVYDNPERVHRLLDLTTDAYIRFTRAQKRVIGECCGWHYHSQLKVRGAARICDDSGINLSPEFYREFSRRYNERAFAELEGGWVHYCGGGRQILPEVISSADVTAINFGNPERQDIAEVYSLARPEKIAVLGWPMNLPLPDDATTGVTLTCAADDLPSARKITAAS